MIFYTDPDLAAPEIVFILVEYLFFSVLTVMLIPFLLHCCSESPKGSILLRTAIALWGVFCIIVIAAQFTDAFYYTVSDNQYFRGSLSRC
ncbi:MAG: hypothetical protein IJH07_00030 [Ruminococcus sp.]|nr:hypothetical protein [Ruminococcus sp.]